MKHGKKWMAALLSAFMAFSGPLPDFQTVQAEQVREAVAETIRESVDLSSDLLAGTVYGNEAVVKVSVLENMAVKRQSLSASNITALKGEAVPTDFQASTYVLGTTNPSPGKGSIPGSGAVVKFEVVKNCSVTMVVKGGQKAFYFVQDGTGEDIAGVSDATLALDNTHYYSVQCDLKKGNTYYAYVDGSRASIFGILYSYTEGEDPEEPDNPENPDNPDNPENPDNPDNPDDPGEEELGGTIAFPGAEGGGMYASGGRGGDVYIVTTLEDYGMTEKPIEGSLRYGIESAPDTGRTIVFNVGGTIDLQQKLAFSGKQNITIAGQTAPGEGITIAGYDTDISDSKNLIIRFVRFRVGTENLLNGGDSMDALWGRDNDTFIIDHCTFSWNTDETLSTYRGRNGTVQWCIISESLTVSGHSKGRHGYGGIWGGDNCVFQYNLVANHTSRNPRIGGGCMSDPTKVYSTATLQLSNNVLYNYGYNNCYGGGYAYTNYINNYQKVGPGTRDAIQNQQIDAGESGKPGGFYISGNVKDDGGTVTDYGSSGVKLSGDASGDTKTVIATSPYAPKLTEEVKFNGLTKVTLVSARDCYEPVLNSAGATYPVRDAIDARVVAQVVTDTGSFINVPEEVGGYCAPTVYRGSDFDTDGDGIADAWEAANGLSATDPTDSLAVITDETDPNCGYTWLEVYINDLVKEVVASGYEAPNPTVSIDLENNTIIAEGENITVTATASANNNGSIAAVEFYNGSEMVERKTAAPYTYTYSGLADGTYDISVRAYDNDGNATQSNPSKLHVNSTAGTGDWISVDIGNPGVEGSASLIDGVMTVKSAGKLGRSEGYVSGGNYSDATTDDFHFVYQEFSGDMEIITKLEEYTAVDNHSFNGVMFRESLNNNAAFVGLGLSLVKINETTVWSVYMVDRTSTGAKMPDIGSKIDTPSSAIAAGMPLVSDLNFKTGNDFNGMWLKLSREGNVFKGYVSENGGAWTEVGSFTVSLPEKLYVGFAVDANKVANDLENYATAKFSNIIVDTESAMLSYEVENLSVDGVAVLPIGEDLTVQLTAMNGYVLPEQVEVTMDGQPVEFTYDKETGIIYVANVSGNLVIKAVGVELEKAAISYEVENLEVAGAAEVFVGADLTVLLTGKEGYVLPEQVEVTMDGQPVEFTYDKETGTIYIAKVDGDLVIKAVGVEQKKAAISYEVENLEVTGVTELLVGEDLTAQLTAKEGYVLPEQVEVTMDGQPVGFTYDRETGTIYIAKVDGNLVIKAVGVKQENPDDKKKVTIRYEVENLEVTGVTELTVGEDLTVQLKAKEGYLLPEQVEVIMDGQSAEYTYDKETGTIYVANVSGDLLIKAVGVEQKEPERPEDPDKSDDIGLGVDEDGRWAYYDENGEIDTTMTGLVAYDGSFFYVSEGYLDTDANGFVEYDGAEFFVAGGQLQNVNGLVEDNGKFYFAAGGQKQSKFTGFAEYDGEWFVLVNGILDHTYNGFYDYNGATFVIADGRMISEYSGLYLASDNTWYYIAEGRLLSEYVGLALYDEAWFYIANGRLAADFTGWVNYDGSRFYVIDGMLYN